MQGRFKIQSVCPRNCFTFYFEETLLKLVTTPFVLGNILLQQTDYTLEVKFGLNTIWIEYSIYTMYYCVLHIAPLVWCDIVHKNNSTLCKSTKTLPGR